MERVKRKQKTKIGSIYTCSKEDAQGNGQSNVRTKREKRRKFVEGRKVGTRINE
jgi:hypothetical protein